MKIRIAHAAAFVLAAALGGCSSAADDTGAGKTAQAAQATPEAATPPAAAAPAPDHKAHFGHGPAERLIHAALQDSSLSAEQTAKIQTIADELKTAHQAGKASHGEMRTALAAAVADGKLEDAEIADAKAKILAAFDAQAAAGIKAVNALHAVLTPAQRQALVTRVEERMEKFAGRFQDHEGKERREHEGKEGHEHARKEGKRHGFGRGEPPFAADLGLDDAQKTQLRDAMKAQFEKNQPSPEEFAARKDELKKSLEAFAADDFDAATTPAAAGMRAMAQKHLDMRVAGLRTLLGVLRPEQAQKLSTALTKAPEHEGPMMHPEE